MQSHPSSSQRVMTLSAVHTGTRFLHQFLEVAFHYRRVPIDVFLDDQETQRVYTHNHVHTQKQADQARQLANYPLVVPLRHPYLSLITLIKRTNHEPIDQLVQRHYLYWKFLTELCGMYHRVFYLPIDILAHRSAAMRRRFLEELTEFCKPEMCNEGILDSTAWNWAPVGSTDPNAANRMFEQTGRIPYPTDHLKEIVNWYYAHVETSQLALAR